MAATPESVIKDLKNKKYSTVYFLQGDEPYYIDYIAAYIEQNALDESAKGFNQVVLYGKDVNMSAILNHAKRYPMMSDRQVVIVREAQEIQDIGREEGQKMLESYVKNPLPSTILVLCHKYKTIDGRSSLAKTLDKHATLVNSKQLREWELPDWIEKFVRDQGFTISAQAKQMLADSIGINLQRLSNEFEKMLVNLKGKKEIDADAVQKYVGISKEFNPFELQNALQAKDTYKAYQIVNYFGANPKANPAIMVIAILFGFFTKLLLAHHSRDKSEKGLMSLLGVPPKVAKDYIAALRRYPVAKTIENIHHLRRADMQAKGIDSPSMPDGEILKELVYNLMH